MPNPADRVSERTIFLVMGLGNTAESLLPFKSALASFGKLELLIARDITAPMGDICDIGATAKDFAVRMAEEPRQRDVYIVGYSTGGVLAYEAARVLASMGRTPALVLLIDSSSNASARPPWDNLKKLSKMGKTPGLLMRHLIVTVLLGLRLPSVLRAFVLVITPIVGKTWARPLRRGLLVSLWRTALERYVLGPYHGRVALLLAEKQRVGVVQGDLGWGRFAPQLEIIKACGNHFTLIEPPLLQDNLPQLAKLLA